MDIPAVGGCVCHHANRGIGVRQAGPGEESVAISYVLSTERGILPLVSVRDGNHRPWSGVDTVATEDRLTRSLPKAETGVNSLEGEPASRERGYAGLDHVWIVQNARVFLYLLEGVVHAQSGAVGSC